MSQEIIPRKKAMQEGLPRYYTGKPCKHGHICERYTGNRACVECHHRTTDEWRSKNKDKIKEQYTNWRKENDEYWRNYMKEWRRENAEHRSGSFREWSRNNRDKINRNQAKRIAAKIKATPGWADDDAIDRMYEYSFQLTNQTGIPHEVDHIIPLQGKEVCGLHCADNLRVITAEENRSKSNTLMEELL